MPFLTTRTILTLVVALLVPLMAGCQGGGRPAPPPRMSVVSPPLPPERIVVLKSKRILELRRGDRILDTFPIALGPHPRGPKRQEGDGRTPQGRYTIDWRSADTRYHRELHVSYPNAQDRARAAAMRVKPGGAIFIHGLPPGYDDYNPGRFDDDWTEGCIALSDSGIDKLWNAVHDGTVVDILP